METCFIYFIAVLFLLFAFFLSRKQEYKEKHTVRLTVFICILFSGILFASNIDWFRGFFKSLIMTSIFDTLDKQGKQLEIFYTTTKRVEDEISDTQSKIRKHQEELSQTQKNVKNEQTLIQEQQKRLGNFDILIQELYGSVVTEIYEFGKTDKFTYLRASDNLQLLVFEIKNVPIPQSLRIQYYVSLQPPNSYFFYDNIVFFNWSGGEDQIHQKSYFISYVPDHLHENAHHVLTKNGDKFYIDGKLLRFAHGHFRLGDEIIE